MKREVGKTSKIWILGENGCTTNKALNNHSAVNNKECHFGELTNPDTLSYNRKITIKNMFFLTSYTSAVMATSWLPASSIQLAS